MYVHTYSRCNMCTLIAQHNCLRLVMYLAVEINVLYVLYVLCCTYTHGYACAQRQTKKEEGEKGARDWMNEKTHIHL